MRVDQSVTVCMPGLPDSGPQLAQVQEAPALHHGGGGRHGGERDQGARRSQQSSPGSPVQVRTPTTGRSQCSGCSVKFYSNFNHNSPLDKVSVRRKASQLFIF